MIRSIVLAAALAAIAVPAMAADPVVGDWRTQADDNGNFGLVSIRPCGARICGTVTRAFDSDGQPIKSPNMGKRIVWDMVPQGGGSYRDGKIYAPDRDKTYNARMTLSGSRLKVEGCVLGICRGQTWARAK